MPAVAHAPIEAVRRQGYCVVEQALGDSECLELLGRLAAPRVERSRAGARHLMSVPLIASFAADPRLLAIASAVLDRPALPFRATLFDKSDDANWSVVWHQDTALPMSTRFDAPGWGPWSAKSGILYAHAPTEALERVVALRVHLDDSLATNGPLRVIPATHAYGVLSDAEVEEIARTESSVECVAARGGILVMRPLLIHSSPRIQVSSPRRVLHIEYADSVVLAPGIELAIA
jgi:ectoine hydroxylase-related dioxygenase (phytanoyl-CoA dioxygenase family)